MIKGSLSVSRETYYPYSPLFEPLPTPPDLYLLLQLDHGCQHQCIERTGVGPRVQDGVRIRVDDHC